jgi:hypothetical protein
MLGVLRPEEHRMTGIDAQNEPPRPKHDGMPVLPQIFSKRTKFPHQQAKHRHRSRSLLKKSTPP